jgi:hypothetical protein
MYAPGTILKLKKQKPDQVIPAKVDPDNPDRKRPKTTIPFPYNRVVVVGESPVDHGAGRGGEWSGAGARGVLLQPLSSHASTLDEPFAKLQKLYDVEEVPKNEVEVTPIRVVRAHTYDAGPTPEEVFTKSGGGTPPKEGEIRGRTPHNESPLGPVEPDPSDLGPLDDE